MLAKGLFGAFLRSTAGRRAASTATSTGEAWAKELSEKVIPWTHTGNAEFPYAATVRGTPLKIRVNDFPEENLVSVIDTNSGNALFHTNDMLPNWELPLSMNRTPK
jgi:hypothetical protein